MVEIDVDLIKQNFSYDKETGVFTWLTGQYKGLVAGSKQSQGYVYMMLRKKRFYAHRAAIAYVTGEWPDGYVDHINFNTSDNSYSNLRVVTRSQNLHHKRATKNKTGLKGVRETKYGTYEALITSNKKTTHLGTYKTKVEAHTAYKTAAIGIYGDIATY